jgi:AraC-like DNA-binding protein
LLNLSVGEMAQRFSCSRRHLNRLFHQYFGFSVASIRMEMRLLKAVSLLRDPDIKVIDVAERCGFNHLGLFNGCFRRRFNASPGQWRKLTLQSPAEPASDRHHGQDSGCPLQSQGLCPWMGNHHGVSPMRAVKGKLKTPLKALGFECSPEPVHSRNKSGAPARNRARKPLDTSSFEIGK